jgi:hypothetical protein
MEPLKEGEVICSRCNGYKFVIDHNRGTLLTDYRILCEKCGGDGKLDWVENVVGKENHRFRIFDHLTIPQLLVPYPKLVIKDLISICPMGP